MVESTYVSDHPIRRGDEDRLDRRPFAERLAKTLVERQDLSSLVVAIYGPWGDGKTSILHMMEEVLQQSTDVVIVWFNPWYYESEHQLVETFFSSLADALKKKLKTRSEEIGALLMTYGSLLSIPSRSVGQAAEQVGEKLSAGTLEDCRDRIAKILADVDGRVVVLIDDIDRLERLEIQAVFKLVKLSAGFSNISYVLAFDDNVVADSLAERYGGGDSAAGHAFLEKIVQVPLHLPPADELSLRKIAFEGVDRVLKTAEIELNEEELQHFVNNFVRGVQLCLTTLRQAKRYVNALAFGIPILKGEVNIVDQMLVEAVRVFYPQLHLAIRTHPDVFLDERQRLSAAESERKSALFDSFFDALTPMEKRAAQGLIEFLFPRANTSSYDYDSSEDDVWTEQQRICSDLYFHRYFRYAVPSRDIADRDVNALCKDAATSEPIDLAKKIQELSQRGSAERLISKLRQREKVVDERVAKRLAIALAESGSGFPVDEDMFSSVTSTRAQAAILIRNLVVRIASREERVKWAAKVLKAAIPLPFASDCFRFMARGDKESERCISEDKEAEVGKILADRIYGESKTGSIYLLFPDDSASLLLTWKRFWDAKEVEEHLLGQFDKEPKEVIAFLKAFLPTAYSDIARKGDFTGNEYGSVAFLVDPEIIQKHLASLYGDLLDVGESYPYGFDDPLEVRVAKQFAFVHRARESMGA